MFKKKKDKGREPAPEADSAQQNTDSETGRRRRKSSKWTDQEKLTAMTSGIWSSLS